MHPVRRRLSRGRDSIVLQRRHQLIHAVFHRLFDAFGPQHWWPADTPFEVIAGAILTQNTAWKNVEKSLEALRRHGLMSPEAIHAVPDEELASLIRPSGYYNRKAKKLKAFCSYLMDHREGDLDRLLSQDMDQLRPELLQIYGIGPETADSILLYAAHQPSFVVDTYTHRIFSRHGLVPEEADYDELRDYFMDCLEPDVSFFQEYHALIVRAGHLHCRRKPFCSSCPLDEWSTD